MKVQLILGLLGLCLSYSSAGVLTFTNQINGGAGDTVIVDADGIIVNGGIATGGYFDFGFDVDAGLTAATTTGDFASFLANYNILGSDSISASGGAGLDGFYFGGVDYGVPITNPYVGAELYSILGNASDLMSSTQFAVLRSSDSVGSDSPSPDSNVVTLGFNTTTLLGTAGNTTFNFGSGSEPTPSLALVRAVPEPSALLLGAFSVLALLRRKR